MTAETRSALRGEIWFVQLPTDPPEKGARPVVIVSLDERNRHPRAETVLVLPLSTSIHKTAGTQVLLAPGETGLTETSCIRAENITTVLKSSLREPKRPMRSLSNTRICEIADLVRLAMGCPRK
jgi:mRNA-degrading endonuclease toxin of MazEF toxin-antitoxin module